MTEEKKSGIKTKYKVWAGITVLLILYIATWTSLNSKFQATEGGASHYSAALNTSTQKIKGSWEMSQQYLDHESGVFKEFAEARKGFLAAKEAFDALRKQGKDNVIMTQQAQLAQQRFMDLQKAAGLAINVQVERYPKLRGAETTMRAQRTLEEGVNEIKTALDDWIRDIQAYNTAKGGILGATFGKFMSFPTKVDYYKGTIKELNIGSLNPVKKK